MYRDEETPFEDGLVELLAGMYVLSSSRGGFEPMESVYRLSSQSRRLSLEERLRDIDPLALAEARAPTSDPHPPATVQRSMARQDHTYHVGQLHS